MSEVDLWRYHAYAYAFRRIQLNNWDRTYARDELGDWFSLDMVGKAERWYRQKLGRHLPQRFSPASQDTIRPNCEQIPATELTDAERHLLQPHIDQLAAEAKANIAAALDRFP